jgi:hypothetical protein
MGCVWGVGGAWGLANSEKEGIIDSNEGGPFGKSDGEPLTVIWVMAVFLNLFHYEEPFKALNNVTEPH